MKKVLIVLFSVLLILSFTSCKSNNDNSEEIIAIFEEFSKAKTICENAAGIVSVSTTLETLNYSLGGASCIQRYNFEDLLEALGVEESVVTIKDTVGTIKGPYSETSKELTYDITKVSYTIDEEGTETSNPFACKGIYKYTATDSTTTYEYEFTINETTYKVAYSIDANRKYTSASVDGKDVELRLLNTRITQYA